MPFDCPDPEDLIDVSSLNRAFLLLLRDRQRSCQWLEPLPEPLMTRIATLSVPQIDRLSCAPFLLFSIRERDDSLWESLLGEEPNRDLFSSQPAHGDEAGRLTAAALGFLWQLAKRNPYSARLICGASLHFCELIADVTIYRLMASAGARGDLLHLRAASDIRFWTKLLGSGVSRDANAQRAAHLTALRSVLTNPLPRQAESWASAACQSKPPLLRVADRASTTDKQHSF